MKGNQRHQFSIKCECVVIRCGMQLNCKRKSKFSLVTLDSLKKELVITPFGNNKEDQRLVFLIPKLRSIHKKYLDEGKITIEFLEKAERQFLKGADMVANHQIVESYSSILISNASKENLQLLLHKIIDIKKEDSSIAKKTSSPPKPIVKKRPVEQEVQKEGIGLSRKEMRKIAMGPTLKSQKIVQITQNPKEPRVNLLDLPVTLLDSIFEYCQLSLHLRVINRKFSEYVLKNVISIRLRDEIDEQTFNKLCKWAINIQCRMKNVRNINLYDRHENQELIKNCAKTLKFGGWKEMSAKNANQLKGLRIYCLEIPYQIKFDLSALFGIRLVQLRLKSNSLISTRNDFVSTQNLIHILKNVKELKNLQLAYATTDILKFIDHPKRLEEIRIITLSDNLKEGEWEDLRKFQNMKNISVWHFMRGGNKLCNHQISFIFPQNLVELEIGSFISVETLQALPPNIETLKLIGDNFYNSHLQQVILPQLKYLDLTLSRNVRKEALQNMFNLTVATSWDRQTVDFLTPFVADRRIVLTTIK